jgi:gamma-glutamyltranspeptidase / glutathione hydrolase / leukotriene-C4 hydrolase
MKKWTPNILKNSEMERLSVLDDDYELESPNLDKSKCCHPMKSLRKLWIYYPRSACTILALIAIIPLAISLLILSGQNDPNLSNETTTCDTSNAWAKSFVVQSYDTGIVAADDERCSQVGADILTDGGNAMDAAVGVALCLGVVSPASSGLGGGCFILGYNASTQSSLFVDARETAPAGSSQNMFLGKPSASIYGGLAVAIPGELQGLYLAWQTQGGGVSWDRVVTPSIELAKKWKISPTVARYILKIETMVKSNPTLYSTLLGMYFHANLTPKVSGEFVQNPALAATLTGIAQEGPAYLYGSGSSFPETMAQEIQAAGGIVTAEELRSYAPKVREAIEMDVFGYRFLGSPPPSSGGVIVGAILQFLSNYEEPIASQGGPSL